MKKLFLISYVLFMFSSVNAFSQENWTPDLSTTEERLNFLATLYKEHPHFPTANNASLVDPFKVLNRAMNLINELGDNAHSIEIIPANVKGVTYTNSSSFSYDEKAIEEFKKEINNSIDKLEGEIPSFSNVRNDFTEISQKNEKLVDDFLKISPLIYNFENIAVIEEFNSQTLKEKIASLEAADIDNLYDDLLKNHIMPDIQEISKGQLIQKVQSFINQFINKTVKKTLVVKSSDGKSLKTTTLTLQKAPTLVGLFRGCAGSDCSMSTVATYVMDKDADVYWIRKSSDLSQKPDGYVIVTKAKYNGRQYPYIVTVNGKKLGVEDTKVIHSLIAKEYSSNNLILTDVSKNSWTMNTNQVRQGFNYPESQSIEADLSEGWKRVSSSANRGEGTNYYAPEKLKTAKFVNIESEQNKLKISVVRNYLIENYNPYKKVDNLNSLTTYEKAVLASQALEQSSNEAAQVKSILSVNDSQIKLASSVNKSLTSNSAISFNTFMRLVEELDFKFEELYNLNITIRGATIGNLYKSRGLIPMKFANDDVWGKLVRETYGTLKHQFVQVLEMVKTEGWTDQNKKLAQEAILNMYAMPSKYIQNFYKDIEFFFSELDEGFRKTIVSRILHFVSYDEKEFTKLVDFLKDEWVRTYLIENEGELFKNLLTKTIEYPKLQAKRAELIDYYITQGEFGRYNFKRAQFYMELYLFNDVDSPVDKFSEFVKLTIFKDEVKGSNDSAALISESLKVLLKNINNEEDLKKLVTIFNQEDLYRKIGVDNILIDNMNLLSKLFKNNQDLAVLRQNIYTSYIARVKCGGHDYCAKVVTGFVVEDIKTIEDLYAKAKEAQKIDFSKERAKFINACALKLTEFLEL